ncbi:radical SAM family heme chaperone HemW [Anianabacter salinae]|uniref:radical SAM family heme chaperone HemW n=1 Tax=Anianabacter salinae TaxID=2851023 RepID=UPI00225DCE75|nr:radical SAM family heme chaperone HemW [Anianabacter salinae]MBV0913520.1 radical SAM family heme chaperone HemW [Anianabacter salinae]
MRDADQGAGFGLYVHWPFCQAKCPYCDFNSHVVSAIDQARWKAAYVSEIRRIAGLTGPRVLDTIFFGGGTPSLMDPDVVAAVIDTAREVWAPSNDMEITLEANPTSVEAARFAAYRDAGVNRVSMGIQSLNDADLKALGRLHSVAEARKAFGIARDCFDRVSFDLIYARQNQTLDGWKLELTEALDMAADHLSLYQLTIEDGTAFGDRFRRGLLRGLPDDDAGADMYEATQELCNAAGMPAYEVSNHARKSSESRHNMLYWQAGDYAGIGPGAHGRLTLNGLRHATDTPLQPTDWLRAVETGGTGDLTVQPVDGAEQGLEYLLMGLRITGGIDLGRYRSMGGAPLDRAGLERMVDAGLVEQEAGRLRVTPRGRPLLNAVLREIAP